MKDSAVLDYIEELCKTPEQVDLEARAAEVSVKGDLGEEHSQFDDPKDFLKHVMNTHMLIDPKLAVDSAKALLPYYHAKKGEMGKKEQREEQAQTAREGSPFKPRVVK